MKRLHWMILRGLPMPFIASLGILVFLLLLQFLMRYLPDLVGRGLPFGLVTELIAYNLAYMVVLAVPMAVLISTLAVFTRLAETRAYMVISSAGISLPQLIWPVLILGTLLMSFMFYFNHVVLPEANFRARNLWQDIRRKKPGFELEPGVFYTGLQGYSIRAEQISNETNRLAGITIYDYTGSSNELTTILAQDGELVPLDDGSRLDLFLNNGEIHRYQRPSSRSLEERYERIAFGMHRLHLDLSDFEFERSDPTSGSRTDRTMRTSQMSQLVDSLDTRIAKRKVHLAEMMYTADGLRRDVLERRPDTSRFARQDFTVAPVDTPQVVSPPDRFALAGLGRQSLGDVYVRAIDDARSVKSDVETIQNTIKWETYRANRYRVEIHKKNAIAVACVIFILIGVPIGLSVQKSGLGMVGGLSVAIFLFYWVALVQGEKLADREVLSPWFGMWVANMIIGAIGLALTFFRTIDHRVMGRISNSSSRLIEYLQQRFKQGAAVETPEE